MRRVSWGILLLMLAGCSGQEPRPAAPSKGIEPPPTVQVPVKAPAELTSFNPLAGIVEETLPNGLRVLYKPDRSLPRVSTAIGYRMGGVHESEGVTGLAHFLEHMMFDGTDKYDKQGIDDATFKAAGSNNAFTSNDNTVYYFNVAAENLEDILQIESNRMTHCTLEMFETEKKIVMEELNRSLDTPWGLVFQERDRLMFSRHPYHHPVLGWREDLIKMTKEQMAKFYKDYYAPNNATLVIVGDFDLDKTKKLVQRHFGPLTRGKDVPEIDEVEPDQNEPRRKVYDTTYEGDRLAIGYKTVPMGSPDDFVLDVIGTLLTGSRGARLNKRLVEVEGLVSEGAIEAGHESRKYVGVFGITVEPQLDARIDRVEQIIYEELDKLAQEPVPSAELRKAKNITQANFIYGNEGQLNAAITLANLESMGLKTYLKEYLQRIEEISPERIKEVVSKYLHRNKSTAIVANKKQSDAPGGGGGGEKQDPPKRRWYRPVSPVQEADLGEIWDIRLPNGLTIIAKRREGLPVMSLRLWANAHSLWEPENKAGVAYLTAELLDEGSEDITTGKTLSHEEIAERIESIGASLTTGTGGISMKGLTQHRSILFEILKQVILFPSFPEDRLQMVRDAMLDDIAHRKDDPATVASDLFREHVYKGHPAHRPDIGYEDTVKRLTRQDVLAHYKKLYRPDNAVLVVVGDIDPLGVIFELRKALIEWTRQGEPPTLDLPAAPNRVKAVLTETRDTHQVNVYVGNLSLPREHPDYFAARVAEVILCSSPVFSDRLSKAVRVQEGLAYSVGGSLTSGSDLWPGTFYLYVGTEASQKDKALEVVRKEFEKYIAEGPTQQELDDARNYLTKSFYNNWDTTDGLAGYLLAIRRWNLGPDYHRTFRAKVRAVTREDVIRVAKNYIDLDHLTTVIVGPVDKDGNLQKKEDK